MSRVKIIIGGLLTSIFLIFSCISLHLESYKEKSKPEEIKKYTEELIPEIKSFSKDKEAKIIKVKDIQPIPIINIEEHYNLTLLGSEKNLSVNQKDDYFENNISLKEVQMEISLLIKNSPIRFKKSSRRVNKEAKKSLDKIYNLILRPNNLLIEVQGHTDTKGTKKLNQWISQKRADRVKAYLIKKGILAKNIKAKGFGESKLLLIDNPHSEKNRRVEIYIKRR